MYQRSLFPIPKQNGVRKQKLLDRLAMEIFNTPYTSLGSDKQMFVAAQAEAFAGKNGYRQRIIEKVRPVLGRNLNQVEYQLTLEWFISRIPPYIINQAIIYTVDYAKKNSKTIISLKYFSPRVKALFEEIDMEGRSIRARVNTPACEIDTVPWHYGLWHYIYIEGNHSYAGSFNPFFGL